MYKSNEEMIRDCIKTSKIPKELIEGLDKLYPSITIKPDTPLNDIMFNAGQRSVIDFLKKYNQKGE